MIFPFIFTSSIQIPRWLLFGVVGALVACIGSAVFRAANLRGVWGIGFRSLQEALNENFDVAPTWKKPVETTGGSNGQLWIYWDLTSNNGKIMGI